MAGPYAKTEVQIEITDKLVSVPYVEMTLQFMLLFGVSVENENLSISCSQHAIQSPENLRGR
ncbi:MAG: hypothetical protein CM1200mP30_34400 [Pseudomonadota bacterium]|nr:MAG: hypothetical protein CM1200mP30_34400 [Pseudomonadota bacterium]